MTWSGPPDKKRLSRHAPTLQKRAGHDDLGAREAGELLQGEGAAGLR